MLQKIVISGIFMAILLIGPISLATNLNHKLYMISIHSDTINERLKEGGRIADYSIVIYGANIRGIPKINKGWHVEVRNESPQLKSFAPQGAGDLTNQNIMAGAFTNFLLVETTPEYGDLSIEVRFSVSFTTDKDDEVFTVDTKEIVKEWVGCPDSFM